jgi:cytochrome o ubiquinol oxidase subunit 2
MLSGLTSSGVLDPQGPVAHSERLILFDATVIMLAVIVPVIIAILAVAWWFRAGNTRAAYRPDWAYSGRLEFIVWSIPALVVLFLGGIAWVSSHDLDPHKPLAETQPLEIQVVSLDWKWLFIYPEQGIAGVNRLVVPAGRPLHFKLTSATVMNSFFVPQLGSQIYTMAGMTTQLHLQADKPGTYPGISAQFSGDGFSDMRFNVEAVPETDFDKWVDETKAGGQALDYAGLTQNSKADKPAVYRGVEPGLFEKILDMETEGAEGQQNAPNATVSPRAPVSPRNGGS